LFRKHNSRPIEIRLSRSLLTVDVTDIYIYTLYIYTHIYTVYLAMIMTPKYLIPYHYLETVINFIYLQTIVSLLTSTITLDNHT
jgi:hypothetical protein